MSVDMEATVERYFTDRLARESGAPPPTQKQLKYLVQLGYRGIPKTKREASKLIEQLQPPATGRQIDFLYELNYYGPKPETKKEASQLISELLEGSR